MEINFPQIKNVSYLCARDPSILSFNIPRENVRVNLGEELCETTKSSVDSTKSASKDDGSLQVYLRIKKTDSFEDLYEVSEDTLLCKVPAGAQCIRNFRSDTSITKTFKFTKIFGSESSQSDIFNSVVKGKVLQFINGFNCNLLTYGASGSGKTFTIVGTADEPGVIPRALEYLFRTLPQLPDQPLIKPLGSGGIVRLTESNSKLAKTSLNAFVNNIDRLHHMRTYKAMQQRLSQEPVAVIADDVSDICLSVWVSFAEIYNEYIYDLLAPEPPRGQARRKLRLGKSNGCTYIKDLTCINISSGLEAYYVLQYGLHNLKYAATSINDHSSRSHSIFTVKLAQASNTKEGISVSSFNFCDLAGSERVKKTNNCGDRLKESNNINTSLLVLGRCISMVREAQKSNSHKLIPFRESKLTQLFQRALSGQEAISMVVNINPVRGMFDESQHVLNFSAIAKDITVEQQQLVQHPRNNRFSQYMENLDLSTIVDNFGDEEVEELQTRIQMLQNELVEQKLVFEDERESTEQMFKKILAETIEQWEAECQRIHDQLAEFIRNPHDTSMHLKKKRKTSVVIIDSSEDEEDEAETRCSKKVCDPSCEFVQAELTQTKLKLQAKEEEVRELSTKHKLLEKTMEDAHKAYLDLQTQYEATSKELNSKVIQQEEQISDLNMYIEALHLKSASNVDLKDESSKENLPPCDPEGVPFI